MANNESNDRVKVSYILIFWIESILKRFSKQDVKELFSFDDETDSIHFVPQNRQEPIVNVSKYGKDIFGNEIDDMISD